MQGLEFGRRMAQVAVRYARGDEKALEEFLNDMALPFRKKDRIYFLGRPGHPRATVTPGDPASVYTSLAYVFLGIVWFTSTIGLEGLRELLRLTKEGE